jgi:short subunit dehydrogenase-like uncharacterized protein
MQSSSSRIVLFGATGYAGRRVAQALVRRGARPVLLGRSGPGLEAVARELAGSRDAGAGRDGGRLETRTASAEDPETIAAAIGPGDVLVTTVGPFTRFGHAAATAAVRAGAHYLDCAGEPRFLRELAERHGLPAERAGIAMLPAFAPEWLLGTVAGAAAVQRAGQAAVRVDCGYFVLREEDDKPIGLASLARSFAGGSFASAPALLTEEGFAWHDGRLVTDRFASRARRFRFAGRSMTGLSVGGSEHLALPVAYPRLREINVYLGWFDRLSPAIGVVAPLAAAPLRSRRLGPALRRLADRASARVDGPSEQRVAATRSLTLAAAYDAGGRELAATVTLGPDLYTLTAELLAWGAERLATGGLRRAGAAGAVEAFGLEELRGALASAGVDLTTRDRASVAR